MRILDDLEQGDDVGMISASGQHLRFMAPPCSRTGSHPAQQVSIVGGMLTIYTPTPEGDTSQDPQF